MRPKGFRDIHWEDDLHLAVQRKKLSVVWLAQNLRANALCVSSATMRLMGSISALRCLTFGKRHGCLEEAGIVVVVYLCLALNLIHKGDLLGNESRDAKTKK